MEHTMVLKTVEGFTDELFFNFCQANETIDFERDSEGNIILMAPTGSETGNYNASILGELYIWNRMHKKGKVFDSSTGFLLPNSAIRSPDVSWMRKEKWLAIPIEKRKKFAPVCPDFVIEILSETDILKEAQAKMQEWIANGCQLAWLIDRRKKQVHIYQPQGKLTLVSFVQPLFGENVLPNFVLDLKTIE